jgi:hypothetical protein
MPRGNTPGAWVVLEWAPKARVPPTLPDRVMSDPNAGPASEPLQFDRAVDAADSSDAAGGHPTLECSSCHAQIKTYYYHVDGNAVCAKCKQVAEQAGQSHRGMGAFVKAFFVGGVAAVLGAAIYYGVIAITNFEIGLVAILIGFMVGYGVRIGAAGAGGRRYQVLALVLTYFAVGLAYTPLAVKGVMDASEAAADSVAVADSLVADSTDAEFAAAEESEAVEDSAAVELAGDTTASAAIKVGMGSALLGLSIVAVGSFLMVFALPVIAVLGSLPSGLISALIIGLGMQQAWKMTAGHLVSITGPYKVGAELAPADGAEPAAEPAA